MHTAEELIRMLQDGDTPDRDLDEALAAFIRSQETVCPIPTDLCFTGSIADAVALPACLGLGWAQVISGIRDFDRWNAAGCRAQQGDVAEYCRLFLAAALRSLQSGPPPAAWLP